METDFSFNKSPVYFTSICREVTFRHESGLLSALSDSLALHTGQFISASPLKPDCNFFSFQIVNPGKRNIIAIGVCPKDYPPGLLPGMGDGSIGYHADDGCLYVASIKAVNKVNRCGVGDVMKCEVNFRNSSISFFKNGYLVHNVDNIRTTDNLHAAIGLYSEGEVVFLMERRPWQRPEIQKRNNLLDGGNVISGRSFFNEISKCISILLGATKNYNTDEEESSDSASYNGQILPYYWTLKKSVKTTNYLVEIDEATKNSIEKLVRWTFDSTLVGVGKDARNLNHFSIRVINVKRIENHALFKSYHLQRKCIRKKIITNRRFDLEVENLVGSKGKIKTTELLSDQIKRGLMHDINEHYLFHGTKENNVYTIIKSGFDIRISNADNMFGKGIYATDSFTKSDQYTDDISQRSGKGSRLNVLLVRMTLGNVFLCDETHTTVANRNSAKLNRPPCMECHEDICNCENQVLYDSVMGDGRWLHREFVVYNNHQCYPEYLITYERV